MARAEPFGHEKLIVYQKGMRFASLRGDLLDEVHVEQGRELLRRIAAMITALPKRAGNDTDTLPPS